MGAALRILMFPKIGAGVFGALIGLILIAVSTAFWIPFVESLNKNEDQTILHNFKISVSLTLIGMFILFLGILIPLRPIL